MERWAEHYQELYSRENRVTSEAIESTDQLPVLEELDNPPSVEVLSKAINSLASGKAPGNDGIPSSGGHQGWQEDSTPSSLTPATATVLGNRHSAPGLAQCKHHHAVQK